MVHKKYIRRGNKIFGPYLYQNYRENGVTKTRYLGIGKTGKSKNWFLILGVIFLLVFIAGMVGLFLTEKPDFFKQEIDSEGLASISFFSNIADIFMTSSPLNVFVQIIDNASPEIILLEDEIFVCEKDKLDFWFKATDEDGVGDITGVFLTPLDPFWISYTEFDSETIDINIYSEVLDQEDINNRKSNEGDWAIYPETIEVSDEISSDSATLEIVVIDVNNIPEFDIGVQTIEVYTKGENNTFYYNIGEDLEDNLEETLTSDLVFDLTESDGSDSIFNITDEGIINITGNESFILSGNFTTYDLRVCVNDTGILSPHSNLIDCWEYGDDNPAGHCEDFSLTITKENRVPNITSYYPLDLNLDALGEEILSFNLTAFDADLTPLDVYWYVDNSSEHESSGLIGEEVSEFKYSFSCGVSGNYTIKAIVTDGLANDSIEWNMSISKTTCPVLISSGAGGGGGGRLYCVEKWGCKEWRQCERFSALSELGWVEEETELIIKDRCELFKWEGEFCGFQQRDCIDTEYCKTEYLKPGFIRECYYTDNPTCEDGIKNCHEDKCEILVDCGGPCEPCPTCSDNLKNQGEEYIDCGGPCKACLEYAWVPSAFKSVVSYSLIALLVLVLVLAFKQIIKYTKFKKIFTQRSIKNRVRKGVRKGPNVKKVVISLFFIGFVIVFLVLGNFYILNFTQEAGREPVSGDLEFLANYGFANAVFSNLGLFFVSGPVLSNDGRTELVLGDGSDNAIKIYNGQEFYFYANYTYVSDDSPVIVGICQIRFGNYEGGFSDWENMVYGPGSEFFETLTSFDYSGIYNFEVECSEDGVNGLVSSSEEFIVSNSPPEFIEIAYQTTYIGVEDTVLIHDLNENVTEIDMNDIGNLNFIFEEINGDFNIENYPWINLTSNGILIINSTLNSEAQNFVFSINVLDGQPEGETREFSFNIAERNDPPVFVNLDNQTIVVGDEFDYTVSISDEEGDSPFVFGVEFVDCVSIGNPSCELFTSNEYFNGDELVIVFTPEEADVGEYAINFSVRDSDNVLGDAISYQTVNFTVQLPIWKSPVDLEHVFNEGDRIYFNLGENVTTEFGDISFSNGSSTPSLPFSFSLTPEGILEFTPDDADVGNWLIEIIANTSSSQSSKIFNFTIFNMNDSVSVILEPSVGYETWHSSTRELIIKENKKVEIYLSAEDDDFLIEETQKDFYDEEIFLDLSIEGFNDSLFDFVFEDMFFGNQKKYIAEFTARDIDDVEYYNITVNVTDANNFSNASLSFNLTILNQDYDIPEITFPDENQEFNIKENVSYGLNFNVNHTVADELNYSFYINKILRENFLGPGDNSTFTWQFAPNFTDETYENKTNLTLLVVNPWDNDFNISRTWNLTINHTNAPVEFIREIGDKEGLSLNYAIEIDLKDHFSDVDYFDENYNQSVRFDINGSKGIIRITEVSEDWIFVASSSSAVNETFNITAYDINNETGEDITNITSNNFIIKFVPPAVVNVPVPTSGSSTPKIVSLKIIMPGQISTYEGETLEIPLQLINSGKTTFNDLNLNSSAFKGGNLAEKIVISLDKTEFKTLKPGQEENLTLTVYFNTNKTGRYEVLVEAVSKSPKYKDWGKMYFDLQKINESQVRELIVFTEEFIAGNPKCIEISENVKEAERLLELGDFVNARAKIEQALTSCKNAISQVSVAKLKIPYFTVSLYLFIVVLVALILGIVYYLIKRRMFQKRNLVKKIPEKQIPKV